MTSAAIGHASASVRYGMENRRMVLGVTVMLSGASGVAATAISVAGGRARDRRRDKARTQAARDENQVVRRAAARFVALELDQASQLLARTEDQSDSLPAAKATTAAWEQYRERLARQLGPADWLRVTEAYDFVDQINRAIDERSACRLSRTTETSDPELDVSLPTIWFAIRYAIGVLQLDVGDLAVPLMDELSEGERLWGQWTGA